MKLPFSWLKDYVEIDMLPQELAEKLLFCGFEVEEIIYKGKDIQNVVAGKIISITQHPDADKLIICSVDVGKDAPIQIVTGANNIKQGDTIPVALDKSTLPGGIKIKEGKLRGILSQGMLCSGNELNIDDTDYEGASVDGILIIKEDVKSGTDIKNVLGLDEYILDVSITANRPDCQSIYGMAREVAALLNKNLKPLDLFYEENSSDNIENHIDIDVKAPKLCPRYMAKCVKDIKIMPAPHWMQKRLRLCGIKPINAIVDITNYILLETGQPMHAFDKRFLEGKKIIVRTAQKNESIITLNEKSNNLTEEMLVICDINKPVALAGIMGGQNSGIKENTSTVIFESAKFARDSIRKTSRKLALFSDSSSRFEKGIDSKSCELSLNRAMALIYKIGCGTITSGIKDIKDSELLIKTVTAQKSQIDGVLGIEVEKERMLDILNKLEIQSSFDGDTLTCIIPPHREDIEGYPDIAEEIIRFYGYEHLKSTIFKTASITKGGRNLSHNHADRLKDIMTAQGFNEILTYAFINPDCYDKLLIDKDSYLRKAAMLKNPLSEQISAMRTTLVHNMVNVISENTKKKINKGRLFEFSNIYLPEALPLTKLPQEKQVLCFAVFGENEDFYTLKGYAENLCQYFGLDIKIQRASYEFMHTGRCAELVLNDKVIGFLGELHPDVLENYEIKQRVYICGIDYDLIKENINYYNGFNAIPKYPDVERDLAIVVKEDITCAELTQSIQKSGGKLLKEVHLFDTYKGGQIEKGFISMAFSMTFYDENKTLTVEEVDKIINKIISNLKTKHNAELR